MKKLFTLLIACVISVTSVFFVGCKDKDASLSFYAPDGAPALAVAKFIYDGENFGTDATVEYNVVASSDIGGVMQQGTGDIIVMPINAASKLYKANASDQYKMVSVITHGNLYLMSSEPLDVNNLKGKVIGVIGQGLVPDLTLRAVFNKLGVLDDVVVGDTVTENKITLRYFASAQDMIPLLNQGQLTVGLLPEPACSNLVKVASSKTWQRVDLQELYDAQSKSYTQAVVMVKQSIINAYPDLVSVMATKFADNVNWVKQNTTTAVDTVNAKLKQGVTPSLVSANITSQVVDNCKIYWQSSAEAKQSATAYINDVISVGTGLNIPPAKALAEDFFN